MPKKRSATHPPITRELWRALEAGRLPRETFYRLLLEHHLALCPTCAKEFEAHRASRDTRQRTTMPSVEARREERRAARVVAALRRRPQRIETRVSGGLSLTSRARRWRGSSLTRALQRCPPMLRAPWNLVRSQSLRLRRVSHQLVTSVCWHVRIKATLFVPWAGSVTQEDTSRPHAERLTSLTTMVDESQTLRSTRHLTGWRVPSVAN